MYILTVVLDFRSFMLTLARRVESHLQERSTHPLPPSPTLKNVSPSSQIAYCSSRQYITTCNNWCDVIWRRWGSIWLWHIDLGMLRWNNIYSSSVLGYLLSYLSMSMVLHSSHGHWRSINVSRTRWNPCGATRGFHSYNTGHPLLQIQIFVSETRAAVAQ